MFIGFGICPPPAQPSAQLQPETCRSVKSRIHRRECRGELLRMRRQLLNHQSSTVSNQRSLPHLASSLRSQSSRRVAVSLFWMNSATAEVQRNGITANCGLSNELLSLDCQHAMALALCVMVCVDAFTVVDMKMENVYKEKHARCKRASVHPIYLECFQYVELHFVCVCLCGTVALLHSHNISGLCSNGATDEKHMENHALTQRKTNLDCTAFGIECSFLSVSVHCSSPLTSHTTCERDSGSQ